MRIPETLLARETDADICEAEAAIERLAEKVVDDVPVRDVWLLRMRALLARAHGDPDACAEDAPVVPGFVFGRTPGTSIAAPTVCEVGREHPN